MPQPTTCTVTLDDRLPTRSVAFTPRSHGASVSRHRFDPPEVASAGGEAPVELIETALARLAASSVAELRFLRVDRSADEIHLRGRVRSFYHKQLAQEAVRTVTEGHQLINRVEVS